MDPIPSGCRAFIGGASLRIRAARALARANHSAIRRALRKSCLPLKVSVVIPARNEERTIGALLDSLLRQTHPAAEIIVVDAGSADRTAQIVREYQEKTIRLISIAPAFPGTARNAGVERAMSDDIAFTDAGIQLDPQWLERLCAARQQVPDSDVIFGSYQPLTPTFFARCA